jgi:hypothetical protein
MPVDSPVFSARTANLSQRVIAVGGKVSLRIDIKVVREE